LIPSLLCRQYLRNKTFHAPCSPLRMKRLATVETVQQWSVFLSVGFSWRRLWRWQPIGRPIGAINRDDGSSKHLWIVSLLLRVYIPEAVCYLTSFALMFVC
jgi:hypothetical protein